MDSNINTLLTEKEAATLLLAQPCTLTKWRHRGRGPIFLKLSGKVRYKLTDIEAFIEKSRVVPSERKRRHNKRTLRPALPPAPATQNQKPAPGDRLTLRKRAVAK